MKAVLTRNAGMIITDHCVQSASTSNQARARHANRRAILGAGAKSNKTTITIAMTYQEGNGAK